MNATNALPRRNQAAAITGCCPPFEPKAYDGQTFEFSNKPFMKVSTRSLLHLPLNLGSVMKRAQAKIAAAGADSGEYFTLSAEVSPWRADHYIAVAGAVPGAETVYLTGTYLAKVFEGPYQEMPHWQAQLLEYAKTRGQTPIQTYFSYTVCPACAKAYGKNYVIGFAQVA